MSSTQQLLLGEGAGGAAPVYIEDVFSTWLYTGTGAAQTIVNGIDLSTKGGLVWSKARSTADSNYLCDTVRGRAYYLITNAALAQDGPSNSSSDITSFNSTGYSLGPDSQANINTNAITFASWTFREQPKFFDIVTYSGSNSSQTISHNLGSTPGCIIIKKLDSNLFNAGWAVYHRSLSNPNNYYLTLNNTDAETNYGGAFISSVNSTTFTIAGGAGQISIAGSTYVAYLFAHNAGGFGLTGSDNVISCGSYTGNGSTTGPIVTLGYEPQWLLIKSTASGSAWVVIDNMRGMTVGGADAYLKPNSTDAETTVLDLLSPTATGFQLTSTLGLVNGANDYIYVAIRRGPMKVPTSGTSVFDPETYTGDNSNTRVITTGFPPDMVWTGTPADGGRRVGDRLRGLFTNPGPINATYSSSDEQLSSYSSPQMNGWQTGNGTVRFENSTGINYVLHAFRRAPSFFDVVCYTGTGSQQNITHNLGVAPELIFVKSRSVANGGLAYNKTITASKYIKLFFTGEGDYAAVNDTGGFAGVEPTSSVFTVGTYTNVNQSGQTYVAYLFATCAGVSKVGTYTGTAALLTVNCGFSSGARFVLIKRTDSTGGWYLYDSARGITSGNDPYLLLNSSAAEVTGTNYVDTDTTGFKVTAAAPAGLNASGGTYIFLAIA